MKIEDISEFRINFFLETDGFGLWSKRKARIRCNRLQLVCREKEREYGELCVYFDKRYWNPKMHGLIYTDKTFENGLRKKLQKLSFVAKENVHYSESGMQGDNYVSLDVYDGFVESWDAKLKKLSCLK